jgi:Zn-finger nucleic acid-binding protein
MQALNRTGVEFDMCPSCRGVWLDRGELEKVIENVRAEANAQPAPPIERQAAPRHAVQPSPSYGELGEQGERGEYGERGEHGQSHDPRQRRRRGFEMFDIFD